MRWVVAQPGPAFSVHDVYVGWVEALRELGQNVIGFNLDERMTFYGNAYFKLNDEVRRVSGEQAVQFATNGLYATLYRARPDVLMVVSGFYFPADLYLMARTYGTKIVVLHTESPYEDDRQALVAACADVNLVNDPTNLHTFPKNTRYVPHAYRPTLHHPGPPVGEMVCDLGFVGTGYPSRIGFLEQMDLGGLDVLLGGNWVGLAEDSPLRKYLAHEAEECLDNDQTADVYRSARVGMNLYRREAHRDDLVAGYAMGPREVEMAACGLFFLRDPRPEGDELFPSLPTFTTPAEASELVRWWLEHPVQRQDAATKAREAIADRTFTHHAADLLRLLDK